MDKKITESLDKHLAKYQELVGKRKALQQRLDKVNKEKGSVKDAILEKVLDEYKKQVNDLENQLAPMKQEVEKTRGMIREEMAKIEEEVAALEDQIQEFSLRHRVGEFDDEELSKLKDPVQQKSQELDQRKKKLTDAEKRLDDTGGDAGEQTSGEPSAPPIETKAPAAKADKPDEDAAGKKPAPETADKPDEHAADKKPAPETADKPDEHTRDKKPAATPADQPAENIEDKKEDPTREDPPSPPKPPARPAAPSAPVAASKETPKKAPADGGLVDTSEWSKEFDGPGEKPGNGRRHTDKPAPVATDTGDDPFAALDEAFPSDSPATAARPKDTVSTGVGTKDQPKGFPVLIITKGPGSGKKLPLVPMTMTVGREHDNNIELKDEDVSRYHARISHESGQYVISDLDSSSGTWVNDEKIAEQALNQGDKIRVGGTEMVIDFE